MLQDKSVKAITDHFSNSKGFIMCAPIGVGRIVTLKKVAEDLNMSLKTIGSNDLSYAASAENIFEALDLDNTEVIVVEYSNLTDLEKDIFANLAYFGNHRGHKPANMKSLVLLMDSTSESVTLFHS